MFHALRFMVILLAFLLVSTVPASAQDAETEPPEDEEDRLAEMYAETYDVDIEEAKRRLKLQDKVGGLRYQLRTNEAETFAGMWIEHTPEFKIIAQFTGDNGQEIIQPYLEGSPLAGIVEVRPAEISRVDLIDGLMTAVERIRALLIPVDANGNIKTGEVEIYVVQREALEDALEQSNTELPEFTKIITVEELAQLAREIKKTYIPLMAL